MEMENGEKILDKKAHANLLKELKTINGKPKKIGREKVVRVSSDFKPFLDLNFALKKIGDEKLSKSSKKLHALPKPLEKPVAKRLKRAAGYEKVAIDANKWEGIVNQRRKADQLVFPLEQSKLTVVETKQSSKASSQTPLEQEIYSLLNGAKLLKEKESEEDERIRKAMTLEEIKLKSREIWRRKLLHIRLERKAALLNKSKSRKYHRILRRERVRKKKEEFERLKEKDPEAALAILEDLEKTRITERMSLRHKNSRWLKTQKARLGQDQTAKDSLVENADMRKELLEKLKPPGEEEDDEDDFEELLKEQEVWISSGAVDASNRWVSQLALPQGQEEEREEDTSFYKTKMFWEEFNKRKIQELQAQREVEKREQEMEQKNKENKDARVEEEFAEDGGGSDIEENEGTEEKDDDESEQEEEVEEDEEFTVDGGGSDIEENEGTEETVDDEVDDDESEQEEEVDEEEECKSGSHKRKERKRDSSNSLTLRKSLKEKEECLTSSSSPKKEKNKMKVTENSVKKDKIGTKTKQETKKCEKGTKKSEPKAKKRKSELEENNNDGEREAKKRKMEKNVKLQEKKSCKAGKLKKDGSETKVKKDKSDGKKKLQTIKCEGKKSCKTGKLKKEGNEVETEKDKSDGKKKLQTTKPEGKKSCKTDKLKKEGSGAETKKDVSESKKEPKSKKRKGSFEDPVPEVFIDDVFDRGEQSLASKLKQKVAERKAKATITETKTTGRKSKSKKEDSTSEEPPAASLSHEMEFDFTAKEDSNPNHETVTRARTMEDMDSIPTPAKREKKLLPDATKEKREEATSKEAPTTVHLQDGNITKIKSRRLGGVYPDYSYLKGRRNADDDSDSEEDVEEDLQDLFEDDDNIKEFREEKKSREEAEAPRDVDLFLHGWGRWSGPGIKPSEKLKKRFKIKAPRQRPNKYSSVGNVIYNEKNDVHQNIRKLMVSELPAPFASVRDFEASIRQPIGRKFVPEASHRKLTAPPVVLKMGSVIEPMGEEALLADHEARQGKLKLEKKLNQELSEVKGAKPIKKSRYGKRTTRTMKSRNKNLKVKTLSIVK